MQTLTILAIALSAIAPSHAATATDDGCLLTPSHAVCLEDATPYQSASIAVYSRELGPNPADWIARLTIHADSVCVDTPANGSGCATTHGVSVVDAWGNPDCLSADVRGLTYYACTDGNYVGVSGLGAPTYRVPANVWVWSMFTDAGDDSRLGA